MKNKYYEIAQKLDEEIREVLTAIGVLIKRIRRRR